MNTILNHHTSFEFVVRKKQLTKHKILNSSILLTKLKDTADKTLSPYNDLLIQKPLHFEFDLINHAYLNDELIVKNQLRKLNKTSLELCIVISKKKAKHNDIICKAIFGYAFKKAF